MKTLLDGRSLNGPLLVDPYLDCQEGFLRGSMALSFQRSVNGKCLGAPSTDGSHDLVEWISKNLECRLSDF